MTANLIKKTNNRIRPLIYKKLYKDIDASYLDKKYKHYLITGEDSWSLIDRKYWFKVPLFDASGNKKDLTKKKDGDNDNIESRQTLELNATRDFEEKNEDEKEKHESTCSDCLSDNTCKSCENFVGWWDIRSLLIHITQCLNSSNMGNSYPQYPSDPFTRVPIPYGVLSQIYRRSKELHLKLHCSTLAFLYMVDGKKESLVTRIIRDKARYLNTDEINTILGTWLRFRNINSQDSQGNFIGIWEPKYSQLNQFERSYRQYCQHPPYIFEYGQEIANPRRKLLENMLHQLPREEWNYELDTFPADTNPYHFNPKGLRCYI